MSALTFTPVYKQAMVNGLPQLSYESKRDITGGMTIADLRLRYKHPHSKGTIVGVETRAYDDSFRVVFLYHPVVKPERLLPCEVFVPHLYVFVAMERELPE